MFKNDGESMSSKTENAPKRELVYKNMASLNAIKKIINETNSTLEDPNQLEFSNDLKEIMGGSLGGVLGIGIGGFTIVAAGTGSKVMLVTSGLAAVGGMVGGGMMTGMAVAAAPAAILGAGGAYLYSLRNKERLIQEKQRLVNEIDRKQVLLVKALKDKVNQQEERLAHLEDFQTLLRNSKKSLMDDLTIDN